MFCCFNFRSKPKKRNIVPVSKLLESAQRCKIAYLEEENLKKIITDPSDSSIPLFKFIKRELGHAEKLKFLSNTEKDTQAYLWIKDKVCYITFRGSSSTQDYMQNIKVLPVEIEHQPDTKVHKGFYEQFLCIKDEIERYLADNSELYRTVSVSGHSLGGALAQISVPFIREHQPDSFIICHTFGAPRTGNKTFIEWLESTVNEHYRVANKGDIVSAIPIRRIWQHSMHTCIKIDKNDNLSYPDTDVKWYSRFFTFMRLLNVRNPTKEHSISLYIWRLTAIIRN
jgi:hypothetical protein